MIIKIDWDDQKALYYSPRNHTFYWLHFFLVDGTRMIFV